MPLSEHEQRLLDQIERELYAEDPKFASTVRGTRLRRPARRRRLQGIALFVVGVALLVLGVVVNIRVAEIPVISVLGFLVMFFGVMMAVTSIRQGAETEGGKDSGGPGAGGGGGKASPRRSSFTQRMEERFRQRFEEQ
ncbi:MULTISPECIES: DUF3040 domain-containing protein [Amycolatopsis]|uniref:DUF3040 domain-containing protein n=1 Tax=Amycolatopsis coloradensis TaxID=76021 RepID=A0ACD5BNM1_9PSEU|nr:MULTISPECIES: DUF3040 domain-containing protein [Amycolatopsis]RSN04598.1 hypothetical protein DMC63_39575 [Streptomyces sp. WAC 05977]RSN63202.1 hypothetical protein DMH01_11420 [Amycolatopsis sp. WAC 04182]UUV33939.1 DUF3040 domain-containing protein [Amycolatopsis roodepoortensis]